MQSLDVGGSVATIQGNPTLTTAKGATGNHRSNDRQGSERVVAMTMGTTRFSYMVSDNEGRPSAPTDVTVRVVVSIYQNPMNRFDVDDDGTASPLDVLILINLLNSQGSSLPVDGLPGPPAYVDVNADNRVDPLDVLDVIISASNDLILSIAIRSRRTKSCSSCCVAVSLAATSTYF